MNAGGLRTRTDYGKSCEFVLGITYLLISSLRSAYPLLLKWIITKVVACHDSGILPRLHLADRRNINGTERQRRDLYD